MLGASSSEHNDRMMKGWADRPTAWDSDKKRSRENNEDDWRPDEDEGTPNKRRRSRSRSSSGSSEDEDNSSRNATDVMKPPQLPLPPPVTEGECQQEVFDTSALAKDVVRTVMGDPKNRAKHSGLVRFSKLSVKDHGLRAYFCPCMR